MLALNSTAEHTRTLQRKTVKAATGCGIHRLVVMIFYTTCIFQYNGWMSMRMRTGFRRCLQHNRHCYLMRQFQNLVDQLRVVGEWLRCLPVVLYVGGSSLRRVSQFSVVHECGMDAWRVGEWTMKRIRKAVEMKREGEVKAQSTNQIHFVSTWQPSGIVMTDQSRWISRADRSAIAVTALFSSSADIPYYFSLYFLRHISAQMKVLCKIITIGIA